MKKYQNSVLVLAMILAGMFGISSCSDNSVSTAELPASNPISSPNLSGHIKGTLLSSVGTYLLMDSIWVNPGDTLVVQPGVTIIGQNPSAFMEIQGILLMNGSQDKHIKVTGVAQGQKGGWWSGINCDSSKYCSFKWVDFDNSGGADATGHSRRTIDFYGDANYNCYLDVEDCSFMYAIDDMVGINGGNFTVLRNTAKYCGMPDGDNINIKSGSQGEAAYNLIWSPGGNGIKVNTGKTGRPTDACLHNNTIVSGGFRRAEELGYGILVDASGRAEIYNNIIGDNYEQLLITTAADTTHVKYGNNLFFNSNSTLNTLTNFYPAEGVGKLQGTDVSGVMPKFVNYTNYNTPDNLTDGSNDYHLQSGSPAFGKGLNGTVSTYYGASFSVETDLGAYTNSAGSHK